MLQMRVMNVNERARAAHERDYCACEVGKRLFEVRNLRSMIASKLSFGQPRQRKVTSGPYRIRLRDQFRELNSRGIQLSDETLYIKYMIGTACENSIVQNDV